MTAVDNASTYPYGLVSEGISIGLFDSDGTAITAGAAVVMEGSTDLRVQIADTAAATNFVGICTTAVAATTGTPVPVIGRGPVVKVKIDGTTDVAAGAVLALDTDGSFVGVAAADVTTTFVRATVNTAISNTRAICGIALQAATNNGDSALIMLL